jgi:hypothetical protein
MAGRDASFTHEALGAPRVMRTGGMMGEIVGMAASICKKHGVNPRGVYTDHMDELFTLMQRIIFIRWLEHIGPNYAYTSASATGSSEYNGTYVDDNVNNGSNDPTNNADRWLSTAGVPNWIELTFASPRYISACKIVSGWYDNGSTVSPLRSFVLQYHNGSGWVDIEETQTTSNARTEWAATFPAVQSDRFRLYVTNTPGNISRIFELELYHPNADFNDDGSVDIVDFATFYNLWLDNDSLLPKDLFYDDGVVDMQDFGVFSEFWDW